MRIHTRAVTGHAGIFMKSSHLIHISVSKMSTAKDIIKQKQGKEEPYAVHTADL